MEADQLEGDGVLSEEAQALTIPGFQTGGRVERTGIALVHEGEYILPAPGSEAHLAPDGNAGGPVINYYFPVEIDIVGAIDDEQMRRVAAYVFGELEREFASRM